MNAKMNELAKEMFSTKGFADTETATHDITTTNISSID